MKTPDAARSYFAHVDCGASWSLDGDVAEALCPNCDVFVVRRPRRPDAPAAYAGHGPMRRSATHGRCPICERRLRLADGWIPPHKDSRSVWCGRVPLQPTKEAEPNV